MKIYTNGQIIVPFTPCERTETIEEIEIIEGEEIIVQKEVTKTITSIEELEGYEVVKSYSKLNGSNWFKYTSRQAAFYEANPNATPLEVYNMKIEVYEPTLEDLKAEKITEIVAYDQSDNVNGFYLNGFKVWLDKDTRVGLVNLINRQVAADRTETTLWLGSMSLHLSCELALRMLTELEVYAGDCYNMTAQHKYNVNEVTSKEDVLRYDFTVGYPAMPEFNTDVE